MIKGFYSSCEIAEFCQRHRLSRLPQTKSGWQKRIRREGWESSAMCRKRHRRGGGREFHFALFPEFLIDAMIADEGKTYALTQQLDRKQ